MSPSAAQAAPTPQPISAQPNPSRPVRKMSTSQHPLRLPSYSRGGASPMSFGAAMSGVSFTNGGGGFSYGKNAGDVPGSYGARFYGEGSDATQIPFSTSVSMDFGSFAASGSAFGLGGSSYRGRSYAAAVAGRDYSTANLSTSLASSSGLGSMGRSYSRGQIHDMMAMRSDAELTKEYECCGIKHSGLHALLEHVEDQHPYGVENQNTSSANNSAQNAIDLGFSPMMAMDLELEPDTDAAAPSGTNSTRSTTSPCPVPNYPSTPTTTNTNGTTAVRPDALTAQKGKGFASSFSDMLKSPPTENEVNSPTLMPSTTSSSPDNLPTPTASANPSPPFHAPPKITAASRSAFSSEPQRTGNQRSERAFNEVVSGNKPGAPEDTTQPPGPTAVAPGVSFTAAAAMGIPPAPPLGRQNGRDGTINPAATTTAAPAPAGGDDKKDANGKDANAAGGDRPKPAEPHLPPPSSFTTHKAWRCPNPGCNKAYKQSNGLKYHLQKGQCDFAIHDAIDHGLTLEEAEERSRPYVCAVGAGCTKRYRQMNGLKYHYSNSGEHGQYGSRMLQNGTHPHPPSSPPPPKRDRPNQNARQHAAPYNVPNHRATAATTTTAATNAAATGPRMGTWPTKPAQPTAGGVQRTAATAQPQNAAATPAAAARPAAAPKMAPVQRGRDAVLFANTEPLDV